jgi:uncharacterized membrane protein
LFLLFCLGCIIVVINLLVLFVWMVVPKESSFGRGMGNLVGQFKYNVYIRFYMLAYFDLTFFAVMKYVEGN